MRYKRLLTKTEVRLEISKEKNMNKLRDLKKIAKLQEKNRVSRPTYKTRSQITRWIKNNKQSSQEFKNKVKIFALKSYQKNGKEAFVLVIPKGIKLPQIRRNKKR